MYKKVGNPDRGTNMAASINLSTTTSRQNLGIVGDTESEITMDEEQSLRECEAYVQKHDIQKILKVIFGRFFLYPECVIFGF